MTILQRIIKYFAIALAAIIIVSIISATTIALRGLAWITSKGKVSDTNLQSINIENTDVTTLNINLMATNLKIKQSDTLKAETNSDNIECIQNDKKLEIREKDKKHFSNKNDETLIIYIPEDLTFEQVHIEVGAGKIEVESFSTKSIHFELGAGKAEFNKLNVTESARVETGAGKLQISSGEIKNLDLDMGAGDVNISSKLTGNSKIDAGIGNFSIKLNGSKDDYKIKVSKGLGPIKIDNRDTANGETTGNGENNIDINGGIGNVDIKFE